VVLAFAYRRLA
jgi:hypothetical protein